MPVYKMKEKNHTIRWISKAEIYILFIWWIKWILLKNKTIKIYIYMIKKENDDNSSLY